MFRQTIVGKTSFKYNLKPVSGGYVTIDNDLFYKIAHYDCMNPFFMSIVSNSDHWMFISSNGALTAGRKNPDHALFPYYTEDKIQDNAEITGSKTIIRIEEKRRCFLWEPFSSRYQGLYNIDRNIYKNIYGNKIIFEEINNYLKLCFCYTWLNSERFGFIKKSKIINQGRKRVEVKLLDGIQNLLPYGISQRFQADYSTLADAYRKNELEPAAGLGIYSLSSIPVDKAEPSESLKATTVWSAGIQVQNILISSSQLDSFRNGLAVKPETDKRAVRGAYLLNIVTRLAEQQEKTWYIVADVDQDAADVVTLTRMLVNKKDHIHPIEADVDQGTRNLIRMVANSDGLQKSAESLSTSRHFSNVLYNISRGGIFHDNYRIDTLDLIAFIRAANNKIFKKFNHYLRNLPASIDFGELSKQVDQKNDPQLQRLCYEYLPLIFSRRHGDPSRPWNWFSIDIKDEQGEKNLNYQGNWRDIFQNWEALARSFPAYIENMICKFVNASTPDGYNPYRITRSGFDWEVLDPADAWSYIGYWGDHQVIYLLKLLELSRQYHPGKLEYFLTRDIFVYADVPYRLKPYQEILTNPHKTVDFDRQQEECVRKRVRKIGSDGKLVCTGQGNIYQVNLAEKLLVPILSKVSNFIPEAGIWMNTQRPEWNDANNALVGYGVSMVTLYYLRRHILFCRDLFKTFKTGAILLSREVWVWYNTVFRELERQRPLLQASVSAKKRRTVLDRLGAAASIYRSKIYSRGFSGYRSNVKSEQLVKFCELILAYIDHSIRANRREDQLYHAYNLMKTGKQKTITIRHLYEMLEGQVAVLSSGFLTGRQAIRLLRALRNSKLYRENQNSYILYPDRQLPRFSKKNNIPAGAIKSPALLKILLGSKNKMIVKRDVKGGLHFNGAFRNAADLRQALYDIRQDNPRSLTTEDIDQVLKIFEDMFDHQSFTGRSGTFYKYEGLGCIYWHMVSKLLLTVQENYYRALRFKEEKAILAELKAYYYAIRAGLGLAKSPDLYGGFPTDPYSHTPAHTGAQQPGMTGQVKEDIISRFAELGIIIHQGMISFHPGLLQREEFLIEAGLFTFFDVNGKQQSIRLGSKCLAFTLVQVPVVYHLAEAEKIVVRRSGNKTETITGLTLDENICSSIFKREGVIKRLDVFLNLR
jgi:hypothetical protein